MCASRHLVLDTSSGDMPWALRPSIHEGGTELHRLRIQRIQDHHLVRLRREAGRVDEGRPSSGQG